MPFIQLETGIRMHYRDGGTGKPILFVPGYSATVDTWNYQVLDLSDSLPMHLCGSPGPRGF